MSQSERLRLAEFTQRVQAQWRLRAQGSIAHFAMLYLPHYLDRPTSRMHGEVYGMLEDVSQRPGARLALAAPRGSAKSTLVSLVFALWCICHRLFRFIVLVSDTAEKAEGFLDQIKHELVRNERLSADYAEVCEPGGQYARWPRWRANEIITHNGVKVAALGLDQNIRGRRHIEHRPDLIILDDVETRENTQTPEARAKVRDWFDKSILKAGTRETRVVVIGTIQHYDSLLAALTDPVKSPLWQGRIYRSVIQWSPRVELWETWTAILRGRQEYDSETGPEAARRYFEENEQAMLKGTEVLWPEVEDYYALMLMRESEGPASFDSEKQNQPVNPQDCFFMEEEFQFWDDRWESEQALITSVGKHARFIGACDPSLGRQGIHADDSAIITLLQDSTAGTLYVLDADIARRKPDRIIEDVLAYQRIRKYSRFAFEANQFQACLAEELKRRSNQAGLYLPVEGITHTTDKLGRIQSLQPLVRSGTLQFSRRHRTLLDQLRLFPKAAHDDGPDCLEMAVDHARRGPAPLKISDLMVSRPRRSMWLPPSYRLGDFARAYRGSGRW